MIGLLAAAAAGAALDLAGAPALLGGPLAAAAGLLVMPLAAWLLDRARRR